MATDVGARFVRRQAAARSNVANTTAANFDYDTSVFNDGGYGIWGAASGQSTAVDTGGDYLVIHGTGEVKDSGTARAVGSNSVMLNAASQGQPGITSHRYVRLSGGANEGVSFGVGLFGLAASTTVGSRVDGNAYGDAVADFDTVADSGGGLQIIRLNDGDAVRLRRTSDQNVGSSNINTTRPWLDSSGTWTKVTWPTEDRDDGNWHAASSGDIVLPANSKFLITGNLRAFNTDASRSTMVARLNVDGTNVQYASVYHRNTAGQGGYAPFMYLHETGGTSETLYVEATMECEGTDNGTMTVRGAIQVKELPSSAEWVHVDNGTTDTLTSALANVTTWYKTPLNSEFRADGNSDLSFDNTNDAVQNDSGGTLPVLAIGWHNWDRDAGTSGTRKVPTGAIFNNGSVVAYGWGGAYSRGQQSADDTWHASYVTAATIDLANGQDVDFRVRDQASASNADMGLYASTSRYFLGLQVLNLETLVDSSSPQSVTVSAAAETETAGSVAAIGAQTIPVGATAETEAAKALVTDLGAGVFIIRHSTVRGGDMLQAATQAQSVTVGAATETETPATVIAQLSGVVVAIGTSNENETGNATTPATSTLVTAAAASEVETAVTVGADSGGAPQLITVAATAETETAVTVGVAVSIGTAGETETAGTVAPVAGPAPQTVPVAVAAEVGTATGLLIAGSISVPVSRAATEQSGGVPHSVPAGVPAAAITGFMSEVETAGVVVPVQSGTPQSVTVTAVTESETGQAVAAVTSDASISVSAASETETSNTVNAAASSTTVTVTAATETETAVTVVGVGNQPVTVGVSTETEAASLIAVGVDSSTFAGWGIPI